MYPFDLFNFVPSEVVATIQLRAAVIFYYSIVFAAAALALRIAYEASHTAFLESVDGAPTPPRKRRPTVR